MDRIELGTYMIAGAISDGDIRLTGGNIALLESFIEKLYEIGIEITQSKDFLKMACDKKLNNKIC